MKRIISVLLIVCVLAGAAGCGGEAAEPTFPAEGEPPVVAYDDRTQTVTVRGAQDYVALSFPEEIEQARAVEVYGDAFTFSAYLPVLRSADWDAQAELPGLIDRTAESLRFVWSIFEKTPARRTPPISRSSRSS